MNLQYAIGKFQIAVSDENGFGAHISFGRTFASYVWNRHARCKATAYRFGGGPVRSWFRHAEGEWVYTGSN